MERTYYLGTAYENYGTGKRGTVSESVTSMDVTRGSTPVYPGTVTVEMISNNPPASYVVDVTNRCTFDWSNVNTNHVGYYYPTIKFDYGQKHYSNSITLHVVPPQTGWNTLWEGSVATSGDVYNYSWDDLAWSTKPKVRITFAVSFSGSGTLQYYDSSTSTWSTTAITSPAEFTVTTNNKTNLLGFKVYDTTQPANSTTIYFSNELYSFELKKYYAGYAGGTVDSTLNVTITKIEQYFE